MARHHNPKTGEKAVRVIMCVAKMSFVFEFIAGLIMIHRADIGHDDLLLPW